MVAHAWMCFVCALYPMRRQSMIATMKQTMATGIHLRMSACLASAAVFPAYFLLSAESDALIALTASSFSPMPRTSCILRVTTLWISARSSLSFDRLRCVRVSAYNRLVCQARRRCQRAIERCDLTHSSATQSLTALLRWHRRAPAHLLDEGVELDEGVRPRGLLDLLPTEERVELPLKLVEVLVRELFGVSLRGETCAARRRGRGSGLDAWVGEGARTHKRKS